MKPLVLLHPFYPPPYSFNKRVLGTEEARVRESAGPQAAHRLWEKSEYTRVNHQAEKRVTPRAQTRYLCCSDSFLCKGGKTGKRYWEEAAPERQEYLACGWL